MSSEEVNMTFIKTETEFDAVHPRFLKQDPEELRKYEKEHNFYCEECNQFFAPTVEGVKWHFKGDMVKHTPYHMNCSYCDGKVYQYYFNDVRKLYHSCPRPTD